MNENVKIAEQLLLQQVSNGDIHAFSKLYHMYAPGLYNRLSRIVKNPENVEEILQDAFLKIWDKRSAIEPDKGFKTFLYRIADHLAIDLFRKATRDKALQLELWAASISFYFHAEETLLNKEKAAIIQEAIQRLTPKRREILTLCKLEEKSYKEVADLLGLSISTVSNQLVSAMKDVRSYIVANYSHDYLISFLFLFITTI
ncbi:RNA polymerase sigma factor [Sphingobacterium sp. LRF_L2]|uniref:RNA polymerase sigma factor n=1 Tax=Sphingobacterium sp. LRF_L2 TaxID=3369421 RepID=UPI003F5E5242